jgi:hypothetical protein
MKQIDDVLLVIEESTNLKNINTELTRHNLVLDNEQKLHINNLLAEISRHTTTVNKLESTLSIITQESYTLSKDGMTLILNGRKYILTNPPDPSFDTLNTQENLFENIVWAKGSLGWIPSPTYASSGVVASNYGEVSKLNIKKGSWSDIIYKGLGSNSSIPKTGLDDKIPSLIDDKFLSFSNLRATYYETTGNSITPIPRPREMWLVHRYMPGQRYEEMLAGGANADIYGDLSATMRIVDPSYGEVVGSIFPEVYKTHISRIKYTDTYADLWIDNVYQGRVTYQNEEIPSYTKGDEVIGVVSNNAVWDFAAQYYKSGNFNDADATTIYNSLATKWNVGVLPNQILLSNMGWSHDGTKFIPAATVSNLPVGMTTAAMSTWDYQWCQDDGTLNENTQKIWSTSYQPLLTDFNSANGNRVKVKMRPKNTLGASWRYFDGGPYILYS